MENSKEHKLFTIAIPTYNHHDQLLEQLKILQPQLNDRVDCIIIDNNSDIPVELFLKDKLILDDRIRIVRNENNIGIDANILKCLRVSNTDWVWTLSDNDYILNDAVEKVAKIIMENNNSVFINFYAGKNKFGKFKGYKEFCINVCYWSTFSVSHCAFNTKKFRPYFNYYEEHVKTHQPQLLSLLKYLKENDAETCVFYNANLFLDLQPAKWSKAAYIYDTFAIYDIIPKQDMPFFKNTIGKQVIKTQLALLAIARTYEGLTLKNYIYLFIRIINNSPKKHLIINKPFSNCLICFLSPKLYYFIRRTKITKEQDYQFSNASKSLKWNY